MLPIKISNLDNRGDQRGVLFTIDKTDLNYLSSIKNIHFGKISRNSIRGNHYHLHRKEILIITYFDQWKLFWAGNKQSEPIEQRFTGTGAVLIKINPGIAHAVLNSGKTDLEIISISDNEFDANQPDTYGSRLI